VNNITTPVRAPIALLACALAVLIAVFFVEGRGEAAFQSATVCSQCHQEIYRTWRASQHASAFTDPVFQLAYDRIRRENPRFTFPCEQCHNPIKFFLAPGDPRAAIFAQEGVTCDFCHSVESMSEVPGFPRYRLTPGIKFGPYPTTGKSKDGVHETRFSQLHITSSFCAGCHEYRNEYDVPIISTYSEWEESFYRGESVHCQFCHLPELFDAQFIDPDRNKGPINHEMVGGHSRERLAKAMPIRANLVLHGEEARATIQLKNDTVGHKAPSGIPIHRIRLETTLYDEAGNALGRKEEIFERVLGDGAGNPITKLDLIFTAAREVLKDNRIGPKETREIVHTFALDGKDPKTAEVALTYEIVTPDIAPRLRSIDVPISRVIIPVKEGTSWRFIALAGLAAVCLVLALGIVLRRSLT
jgi:hypothetical protein